MKYLFLFLFFVSATAPVHAGTVIICGKLDYLQDGDSVRINLDKYGDPRFMGFQSSYSGEVIHHLFRIVIPAGNMPVDIESFNFGMKDRFPHFMNVFVENGDSINITGTPEAFIVSGKGSDKWNMIHQLDSIYFSYHSNLSWGDPKYVRRYFESVDSTVVGQLSWLSTHKSGMSMHAYHLLKANIVGLFHGKKVFFDAMTPEKYAEAVDSLSNYRCGLDLSLLDDPAMLRDTAILYSYIYSNCLMAEYLLDSCIKRNRTYHVDTFYRYVCSHYNGLVKERLVTNLLYKARYMEQNTSVPLSDALQWVSYKDFRSVLQLLNERTRGAVAYNFSLPDVAGHRHSLSDFKGKVVLLDFWYTGCGNCVRVHPYIDSIQKLFAGKDLEVVTINADKDRDWWIESLGSAKYTSADEVNLSTYGKGFDDPVLMHFMVSGYPNLILVDKRGNLMPNPIDPRIDNGATLVALVTHALSD